MRPRRKIKIGVIGGVMITTAVLGYTQWWTTQKEQ
jgi:hypothetical protein